MTSTLSGNGASQPLLREALGISLRQYRQETDRTLRDVADSARVSPGYLSEMERGRKEASSELIAAVCSAMGTSVAEILINTAVVLGAESIAQRDPVLAA